MHGLFQNTLLLFLKDDDSSDYSDFIFDDETHQKQRFTDGISYRPIGNQ
jgi:hypothetical protein